MKQGFLLKNSRKSQQAKSKPIKRIWISFPFSKHHQRLSNFEFPFLQSLQLPLTRSSRRTFRQDFYYRLNVFPLVVAPLRDRKADIPLLATHFIDLSAKEFVYARPILTRLGVEILQKYDWPGNIRELRNVIERAAILAQGGPMG
jgi:sigma54-dependent transcription regulator